MQCVYIVTILKILLWVKLKLPESFRQEAETQKDLLYKEAGLDKLLQKGFFALWIVESINMISYKCGEHLKSLFLYLLSEFMYLEF